MGADCTSTFVIVALIDNTYDTCIQASRQVDLERKKSQDLGFLSRSISGLACIQVSQVRIFDETLGIKLEHLTESIY